jgi:hypothetical protein
MNRYVMTAVASACVGGIATGASASITTGASYQVQQTGAFDVSFVSQSAGWTGSLYFVGAEVDVVLHRADNSDAMDSGQYIFDNHGTPAGHTVSTGEFQTGAILHFAYVVFHGSKDSGNIRYTLSTDSPSSANQFALEQRPTFENAARTTRLHIEDIVGSGSDWDYNDMRADIVARAIPTPGAATLAGFALLIGFTRRRK